VRVTVGLLAAAAAFALAPATVAEPEQPASVAAPGPDLPARSAPALARTARSGGITRRKLKRRLGKLARKAPGASGFYVYDIGAAKKRVLFDRKEGHRRRLASNTKLFTTATALHRLGASARIETRVARRGALTDRGRLKGSLYLVGAGDPSLGSGDLKELAREVRRAGIRRVTGKLVADDSVFDRRRGVPDSGYGPSPYIAPLSGLVYGGSTYSRDPALAAAAAFRSRLRKRGVKVKGGVRLGELPERLRDRPQVAAASSPTIAALAAATNKPSNNFFAEMLLKRLWAKPGRKGTTRGGTKAVERFARKQGSRIDARDGSGLTDANRSSPRDVVRLLVAMREHRAARAFYRSLPVVGREGTVDERMEGTAAAGRCRAKTGTISGVSTLSGYCNAGHGEKVAFSLLMNGVSSYDAALNVQDKMVVEIARFRPQGPRASSAQLPTGSPYIRKTP
jgi:D-alanyl-D-alanine carboxypeptidase/D-alanyl-D-alanine-endopeptidase (penicillin-binding protein 4)